MPENKKMVNGKVRNVHTGKKGGKYYMSKGKKVYFGATKRQRSSGSSNRSDKKRPRSLYTAILGRTMQGLPINQSLGQGFMYGYTQATRGPRTIEGTSCDQIPKEFKEVCKRDYCIRNPLSDWCLQRKIDYRGVDGRQVPKRGPFWQSQCDKVEPMLASNLQTLARKKIKERQYTAANNILYNDNPIFYRVFGSLAPAQQREFLLRMGVTNFSMQPPPPRPLNSISPFGKKKAKRNTKKKTKQTRK